jgi:serine/threonine protein kinase/class 3 adenylate cyclase
MSKLPSGTVTFLFTDVEGSTRLLQHLGKGYVSVLAEHHRILRRAVAELGGREVDSQGESFFFAFERANAAIDAAILAQRALIEHPWPDGGEVRVRMGVHTGEPIVDEERYVGLVVHRAARIGAVGHGGQVLLSNATRELLEDGLAGVSMRDLGSYRLKDFDRDERLYQLDVAGLRSDFPPLNAKRMAEPHAASQADVQIGAEFLGYRIEELIGQGGMGVVYRAYDLRLKRTVALKLVTPELALDDRFRERFTRETELAMALEHPNVVPVHDAGDVAGRLYLAMRLVTGTDLRKLLRAEAPLEASRALSICRQVANALDAAHARGLVHRDVKPSNVLLDEDEHVYLADFGLTRRREEQGAQPGDGRSVGTPAYLAPEQIEGKPLDGRADVYGLGCLLFESLTGTVPYARDSRLAVAWAHLEEEPPRASELNPALPEPVDDVVRAALAKEPEERYRTCGALIEAAEEAFGIRSRWRSRRLLLATGLVAAAAVTAAAAALLVGGGTEPPTVVPNSLVKIDATTRKVVDVVPVGRIPDEITVRGEPGRRDADAGRSPHWIRRDFGALRRERRSRLGGAQPLVGRKRRPAGCTAGRRDIAALRPRCFLAIRAAPAWNPRNVPRSRRRLPLDRDVTGGLRGSDLSRSFVLPPCGRTLGPSPATSVDEVLAPSGRLRPRRCVRIWRGVGGTRRSRRRTPSHQRPDRTREADSRRGLSGRSCDRLRVCLGDAVVQPRCSSNRSDNGPNAGDHPDGKEAHRPRGHP